MKSSDAFPSKYLKASDLQGRQVTVKMTHVEPETIGGDRKFILYFAGKEKGMVLNKTNWNNIAKVYGDDSDDWTGHEIVLFEAFVDFQGDTVPAIRVKGPPTRPSKARPSSADMKEPRHAPPPNDVPAHLDDDIPF